MLKLPSEPTSITIPGSISKAFGKIKFKKKADKKFREIEEIFFNKGFIEELSGTYEELSTISDASTQQPITQNFEEKYTSYLDTLKNESINEIADKFGSLENLIFFADIFLKNDSRFQMNGNLDSQKQAALKKTNFLQSLSAFFNRVDITAAAKYLESDLEMPTNKYILELLNYCPELCESFSTAFLNKVIDTVLDQFPRVSIAFLNNLLKQNGKFRTLFFKNKKFTSEKIQQIFSYLETISQNQSEYYNHYFQFLLVHPENKFLMTQLNQIDVMDFMAIAMKKGNIENLSEWQDDFLEKYLGLPSPSSTPDKLISNKDKFAAEIKKEIEKISDPSASLATPSAPSLPIDLAGAGTGAPQPSLLISTSASDIPAPAAASVTANSAQQNFYHKPPLQKVLTALTDRFIREEVSEHLYKKEEILPPDDNFFKRKLRSLSFAAKNLSNSIYDKINAWKKTPDAPSIAHQFFALLDEEKIWNRKWTWLENSKHSKTSLQENYVKTLLIDKDKNVNETVSQHDAWRISLSDVDWGAFCSKKYGRKLFESETSYTERNLFANLIASKSIFLRLRLTQNGVLPLPHKISNIKATDVTLVMLCLKEPEIKSQVLREIATRSGNEYKLDTNSCLYNELVSQASFDELASLNHTYTNLFSNALSERIACYPDTDFIEFTLKKIDPRNENKSTALINSPPYCKRLLECLSKNIITQENIDKIFQYIPNVLGDVEFDRDIWTKLLTINYSVHERNETRLTPLVTPHRIPKEILQEIFKSADENIIASRHDIFDPYLKSLRPEEKLALFKTRPTFIIASYKNDFQDLFLPETLNREVATAIINLESADLEHFAATFPKTVLAAVKQQNVSIVGKNWEKFFRLTHRNHFLIPPTIVPENQWQHIFNEIDINIIRARINDFIPLFNQEDFSFNNRRAKEIVFEKANDSAASVPVLPTTLSADIPSHRLNLVLKNACLGTSKLSRKLLSALSDTEIHDIQSEVIELISYVGFSGAEIWAFYDKGLHERTALLNALTQRSDLNDFKQALSEIDFNGDPTNIIEKLNFLHAVNPELYIQATEAFPKTTNPLGHKKNDSLITLVSSRISDETLQKNIKLFNPFFVKEEQDPCFNNSPFIEHTLKRIFDANLNAHYEAKQNSQLKTTETASQLSSDQATQELNNYNVALLALIPRTIIQHHAAILKGGWTEKLKGLKSEVTALTNDKTTELHNISLSRKRNAGLPDKLNDLNEKSAAAAKLDIQISLLTTLLATIQKGHLRSSSSASLPPLPPLVDQYVGMKAIDIFNACNSVDEDAFNIYLRQNPGHSKSWTFENDILPILTTLHATTETFLIFVRLFKLEPHKHLEVEISKNISVFLLELGKKLQANAVSTIDLRTPESENKTLRSDAAKFLKQVLGKSSFTDQVKPYIVIPTSSLPSPTSRSPSPTERDRDVPASGETKNEIDKQIIKEPGRRGLLDSINNLASSITLRKTITNERTTQLKPEGLAGSLAQAMEDRRTSLAGTTQKDDVWSEDEAAPVAAASSTTLTGQHARSRRSSRAKQAAAATSTAELVGTQPAVHATPAPAPIPAVPEPAVAAKPVPAVEPATPAASKPAPAPVRAFIPEASAATPKPAAKAAPVPKEKSEQPVAANQQQSTAEIDDLREYFRFDDTVLTDEALSKINAELNKNPGSRKQVIILLSEFAYRYTTSDDIEKCTVVSFSRLFREFCDAEILSPVDPDTNERVTLSESTKDAITNTIREILDNIPLITTYLNSLHSKDCWNTSARDNQGTAAHEIADKSTLEQAAAVSRRSVRLANDGVSKSSTSQGSAAPALSPPEAREASSRAKAAAEKPTTNVAVPQPAVPATPKSAPASGPASAPPPPPPPAAAAIASPKTLPPPPPAAKAQAKKPSDAKAVKQGSGDDSAKAAPVASSDTHQHRNALLDSIQQGTKLKKTITDDRSGAVVSKKKEAKEAAVIPKKSDSLSAPAAHDVSPKAAAQPIASPSANGGGQSIATQVLAVKLRSASDAVAPGKNSLALMLDELPEIINGVQPVSAEKITERTTQLNQLNEVIRTFVTHKNNRTVASDRGQLKENLRSALVKSRLFVSRKGNVNEEVLTALTKRISEYYTSMAATPKRAHSAQSSFWQSPNGTDPSPAAPPPATPPRPDVPAPAVPRRLSR